MTIWWASRRLVLALLYTTLYYSCTAATRSDGPSADPAYTRPPSSTGHGPDSADNPKTLEVGWFVAWRSASPYVCLLLEWPSTVKGFDNLFQFLFLGYHEGGACFMGWWWGLIVKLLLLLLLLLTSPWIEVTKANISICWCLYSYKIVSFHLIFYKFIIYKIWWL